MRHTRKRDVELAGLLFDEASMLQVVLHGKVQPFSLPGIGPTVLSRLVNAGLVQTDDDLTDEPERVTGFRLSDATRFNLCLDEAA